eukprot:3981596-Pleurochrysis_carterae.AAC.1
MFASAVPACRCCSIRRQHKERGPRCSVARGLQRSQKAAATQAEVLADDAALSAIRHRYGERSERLIATLLIFDALFEFRKVMRLRFDSSDPLEREIHAILFAQS